MVPNLQESWGKKRGLSNGYKVRNRTSIHAGFLPIQGVTFAIGRREKQATSNPIAVCGQIHIMNNGPKATLVRFPRRSAQA